MPSIKYLGQIINKNGRKPDPKKIKTINYIPAPTDEATLQSFLGMVNYYNLYVPKIHELGVSFIKLLKKDSKWNWSAVKNHLKILKKYLIQNYH